ncbi:hypothetical protein CXF85_05020 [Colwellia sp. 75C3]|uniref:hypothetical protein n=1 Tax=Colwellia sp. 75C3 TaxID=888425 RepID=UPI000C3328C0|nr:hypothetical protein [Colwellia sp. 75C3]PKG84975.1 hypothetical protein CXF85_05020 [Colwellia sp. 75C3]
MNKLSVTLPLTLIAMLAGSIQLANAAEKTYSLPLSKPGEPVSIEVEVYRGSVTLVGYKGDTIEISATTSVFSGKDDDLKKVKAPKNSNNNPARSNKGLKSVKSQSTRLEIEEKNNDVEISSEFSNQHVDLVIKVPQRSSIEVELHKGGDISIDGISGSLELEAYGGMITAKNISGPIVAETGQTDIVVSFSNFDKTSPSSLTSHMGNVDITLAKKVAANVNVQTYQGEIFSGLDKDFVVIDEIKKNKKGKKQKIVLGGIMQAKVNGGGQALSLTSYSGNLYIRKAK